MAKFRLNQGKLDKLKANILATTEKKKKQLAFALAAWADDTKAQIQAEIMDVGAVDQGLLLGAMSRTEPKQEGTRLTVTVFNPMEYASVVEFGRRAGQGKPPPLLPLVAWAGRKGIIKSLPRNISFGGEWGKAWAASAAIFKRIKAGRKGGKAASKKPLDPQIADLLKVRFIAQKIYEKGIAGRHPFSRIIDRRAPTFAQDIAKLVSLQGR